ncbi:MAG TPA: zinc-dependent metalloprotease [Actinomycetales bacterium]|nr:zinc-dependent metalloprotease [Actinomycetales bacterium]
MTATAATSLLDRYVDWELAAATARRVARPGPEVSTTEAQDVVTELRLAAQVARPHVARITGLDSVDPDPVVLVVDRPGWVRANLWSLRSMLEPVVETMASRRAVEAPAVVTAVGSKVTGLETGGLLAFLSGKVLGQYDINPDGVPRLLLVAPNVVHAEREMDVVAADFRLWVCLHEETHRVQFTAVPWLRQHMIDQVHELATQLAPDPKALLGTLEEAARRLPGILRGEGGSLLDLFTTADQRRRIAALTAVMSLLEGHADVVMDEVGPDVVPTVRTIRDRFNSRRGGKDPLDRVVRRLLGLEDKMRQYRDGAAFVRTVVAEVGMDGFNAVWTSPQTLPAPEEIADPRAWVRRVHG